MTTKFSNAGCVRTHSVDGKLLFEHVTPSLLAALKEMYAEPVRNPESGIVRVFRNYRIPWVDTCIYAIRRRDTREIKIGRCADLKSRLITLQTAHGEPLEVAVWFRGEPHEEVQLQTAFAEYHKLGDWFHECEEIADWVRRQRIQNLTERGFE